MTDTPLHIQNRYSEFIMSKSVMERFQMGFDMSSEGKRMIECAVARQYPDLSEEEQKFAVIERMYWDDFSTEEMARIKASFSAFYESKATESV